MINEEIIDITKDFDKIKKYYYENKKVKAYEDCFYSIIQGIRKKPLFFRKKIFFTYGSKLGKDFLIIYNHLYEKHHDFANALKELLFITRLDYAIYKNASIEEISNLKNEGFREYHNAEHWSQNARFDDQSYPQVVLDVNRLSRLEGKDYKRLRNYCHRFSSAKISFKPYSKINDYVNCEKLVKNISLKISQNSGYDYHEVYDANKVFLEYNPEESYIIYYENKIIGFIGIGVHKTHAFLNSLQILDSYPNIGVFVMYKISQILQSKGVKFFNLSGSENHSLFIWKNKFIPHSLIERMHLVYEIR